MDPTAAAVCTPNTPIITSVIRDTRCNLWSVSLSCKSQRSANSVRHEKFLKLPIFGTVLPPSTFDLEKRNPHEYGLSHYYCDSSSKRFLRDEISLIESSDDFYDRHFLVFRFSASRASNFYRIEHSFHSFSLSRRGRLGGFYTAGKVIEKYRAYSKFSWLWAGVRGQRRKDIKQGLFLFQDFIASQYYTVLYRFLFDTEMMLEEHDLYGCLHSVVSGADCWGIELNCHSCN